MSRKIHSVLPRLRRNFDLRRWRRHKFGGRRLNVLSHNESSANEAQDAMYDQAPNERGTRPFAPGRRRCFARVFDDIHAHGRLSFLLLIAVQRHPFDARLGTDIQHVHNPLMRRLIRRIQRH